LSRARPAPAVPPRGCRRCTRGPHNLQPHTLRLQALRVSVGQLGIIVRLKLQLVPDLPVERSLTELTPVEFLALLRVSCTRGGAQ